MNQLASQFHKQKVLVFGLGLQGGGLGDVRWLHEHGALVRITDKKKEVELTASLKELPTGIELSLGEHRDEDIDWADVVIKNPGVADTETHILRAKEEGKPVYTSIALVVQELRDKVIGITGTRGKSTTTELIYQVMNQAYPGQVIKGGNVPGTSSFALLNQADDCKYLVLELSSFQLHNFHDLKVSPHVAVLTNVYPDHLNRYPSMVEYQEDKEAIFRYQKPGDIAIRQVHALQVPSSWKISLPGSHNRENVATVLAVADALGIAESVVKNIVENFHGLPFRHETIATKQGVIYINDTTSTTPTATIKAVEATSSPTILILGGDTKKLPYEQMIKVVASNQFVKHIILLGSRNIPEFVADLKHACASKILLQVDSMQEAVNLAAGTAKPGDTVLLSPGFASFDLYKNEFDRGQQFNEWVHKLPS